MSMKKDVGREIVGHIAVVLEVGATPKSVFGKDVMEDFHAQEAKKMMPVAPTMKMITLTTIATQVASSSDQINQIKSFTIK